MYYIFHLAVLFVSCVSFDPRVSLQVCCYVPLNSLLSFRFILLSFSPFAAATTEHFVVQDVFVKTYKYELKAVIPLIEVEDRE